MGRRLAWVVAAWLVALAAVPLVVKWRVGYVPIDLQVYLGAGAAIRHGAPLYEGPLADVAGATGSFTYPPFSALPFVPMSYLNLTAATLVWTLLSVAALAALVAISFRSLLYRLPEDRRPLAVGALTAGALFSLPVVNHLFFAQVGVFLVLACVVDVCVVPRRFQGVLIGLASAFKLTSALFIVWFVLTRQWRAAATSSATLAAAWGFAFLILPADTMRYFGQALFFDTDRIVGDVAFVDNQSLLGMTFRLDYSFAQWAPLALTAAGIGLYRAAKAHRLGQPLAAATLVGIATLLASPVSWIHHAMWLVPAGGCLLGSGRVRGRVVATIVLWGTACVVPVNELGPGSVDRLRAQASQWLWPLREGFVVMYAALLLFLPIRAETVDAPADRDSDTATVP